MDQIDNHIVFLGFAVSDGVFLETAMRDKHPQFAAHKLQWNIINGIEEYTSRPLRLVSAVPVSNFPGCRNIIFPLKKWSHAENSEDVCIPFVNVIFAKHVTRFVFSLYHLTEILRKGDWKTGKIRVLVYALHSPFLLASSMAKRLFGGKIAVVVPDMPQYMDLGEKQSIIRRVAKRIDASLLRFLLGKMDGVIALTRHMANDLPDCGIPSMVMEGAVSLDWIRRNEELESTVPADAGGEKVVMYSGALTGLGMLLAAFSRIDDPSYRLWISGRGGMEPEIRAAGKSDSRIKYWGILPDEDLIRLQLRANVLINARSAKTPFIQYSFPSKLLEYMATGRPVLTTALPGIPEEYHEYLFLLREETPEALAAMLTEVCSMPRETLIAFGKRGQQFVKENKNSARQGERICRFLASL